MTMQEILNAMIIECVSDAEAMQAIFYANGNTQRYRIKFTMADGGGDLGSVQITLGADGRYYIYHNGKWCVVFPPDQEPHAFDTQKNSGRVIKWNVNLEHYLNIIERYNHDSLSKRKKSVNSSVSCLYDYDIFENCYDTENEAFLNKSDIVFTGDTQGYDNFSSVVFYNQATGQSLEIIIGDVIGGGSDGAGIRPGSFLFIDGKYCELKRVDEQKWIWEECFMEVLFRNNPEMKHYYEFDKYKNENIRYAKNVGYMYEVDFDICELLECIEAKTTDYKFDADPVDYSEDYDLPDDLTSDPVNTEYNRNYTPVPDYEQYYTTPQYDLNANTMSGLGDGLSVSFNLLNAVVWMAGGIALWELWLKDKVR